MTENEAALDLAKQRFRRANYLVIGAGVAAFLVLSFEPAAALLPAAFVFGWAQTGGA